jgi:hypothetical protein
MCEATIDATPEQIGRQAKQRRRDFRPLCEIVDVV